MRSEKYLELEKKINVLKPDQQVGQNGSNLFNAIKALKEQEDRVELAAKLYAKLPPSGPIFKNQLNGKPWYKELSALKR
ncbi:hypothetical protein D3C86_2104260 [compost metagenome]